MDSIWVSLFHISKVVFFVVLGGIYASLVISMVPSPSANPLGRDNNHNSFVFFLTLAFC